MTPVTLRALRPSGQSALFFLNGAAATLYITFTVMRHVPLEAFPLGWRPALLRWRRSRRAPKKASSNDDVAARGPARRDPFAPTQQPDARFKAWPTLNQSPAAAAAAGVSKRARLELGSPPLEALWPGSTLAERFSRELALRHAVDRKEFFETWEFFAQARSGLQCAEGCAVFIELAAGHALLGVLVALFEPRRFRRVVVADRTRPASFDAVLAAAVAVSPSVADRVEYAVEDFLAGDSQLLPRGAAIACVHACKSLTDAIILAASAAAVESVVCMPCCYPHAAAALQAPVALRRSLGVSMAADVQRTYTLEAAGYEVTWRHIPALITPMNRVLLARMRRGDRKRERPGALQRNGGECGDCDSVVPACEIDR